MTRTPLRVVCAAFAATVVAVLTAVVSPTVAQAAIGGDRFYASEVYRGEFGAPSLLMANGKYYAYATTADGLNLPVMTSPNMGTWRARHAYPLSAGWSTWNGYNDAFPRPAKWAAYHHLGDGRAVTSVWAPSVAQIGSTYVLVYAVPVNDSWKRRCISIATSASPIGPFHDDSTAPLVCSKDPNGTIDPQILQDGSKVYLIWKSAGIRGSESTKIWSRSMTPDGLALAPGTRQHNLLTTKRPWEGNVIEAPDMVKYQNRYYLFYSGNLFNTTQYATGYGICRTPLGPCWRGSRQPLLATGGDVAGPGAASAIVDRHGRLRLAYSAWDRGHVGYPTSAACEKTAYGCNQRRLHIATLAAGRHGLLSVVARG